MMDFEPLSAVPGVDPAAVPEGGMVARLRYQQTKIDGAPDDHPGRRRRRADHPRAAGLGARAAGASARRPRRAYLFPKTHRQPARAPGRGRPAATTPTLRELSRVLGLRDVRRAPAALLPQPPAAPHQGHHLAQRRRPDPRRAALPRAIARRRWRCGMPRPWPAPPSGSSWRWSRSAGTAGNSGWTAGTCSTCSSWTGAPTASCPTGTACFRRSGPATRATPATAATTSPPTAATFPRSAASSPKPSSSSSSRKAQHLARYGEPMSEANVWLEQRLAEIRSMRLEITALEAQPGDDTSRRPRRRRLRQARLPARPGIRHHHQEAARIMTTAVSQPGTAAQRLRRAAPGRCPAPRRPGQAAGRHGPRRDRDPQARSRTSRRSASAPSPAPPESAWTSSTPTPTCAAASRRCAPGSPPGPRPRPPFPQPSQAGD